MPEVVLSVLVVTYNHEEYVVKALESVIKQKVNFYYEVLVGDDASTDRTVEIINKMFAEKVLLFTNEQNVGQTKNLQNLFSKAQGKYITILSGDDWYCSDSVFQEHVNFLEEHKECSGVSNFMSVYDKNEEFIEYICARKDKYTLRDYLQNTPTYTPILTFRNYWKDALNDFDYFCETSRNNEEVALWFYLLEKGVMGEIPKVMFAYRRVTSGGCNYNSTYNYLGKFIDLYNAIKVVEERNCRKYNFKVIILSIVGEYVWGAWKYEKKINALKMIGYMQCDDRLLFWKYFPLLLIKGGCLPNRVIRRMHLIY